MRRRIAVLAVAALIAAPAAVPQAAPAEGGSRLDAVAASHCTGGRKHAVIDGSVKCIAAGQFCKRSAQRDYRRYGYSCSNRDRNGRYHLRRL
jgi:hypothetical protein